MLQRANTDDLDEIDHLSHSEWGAGLPVPVHVAREKTLREGPWPRTTHTGWLFREEGRILASCETYRLPVTLASGGTGVGWGIASVFVPAPLRGRGYASRMLGELLRALQAEDDALALVLFSDVGATLYERLGFVARPAFDRVYPAEKGGLDLGNSSVLWLEEDTLPQAHAATEPVAGPVSLWPQASQLSWHLARARTWAEAQGIPQQGTPPKTHPCGARLRDDLVVWVEDRSIPALRVLLLTGHDPETLPVLLSAAARAAGVFDLPCVYVWETPLRNASRSPSAANRASPPSSWSDGSVRLLRAGGLPMLAPLKAGLDPRGWTFIPRGSWL